MNGFACFKVRGITGVWVSFWVRLRGTQVFIGNRDN